MRNLLTTDFVASIAGAVASITVAAPLDVVKTRIQNANFGSTVSGMTIIREMVRTEGLGAFFKGLTPKVSANRGSVGLGSRYTPFSNVTIHLLMPDPRRRPQARLLLHSGTESYSVSKICTSC